MKEMRLGMCPDCGALLRKSTINSSYGCVRCGRIWRSSPLERVTEVRRRREPLSWAEIARLNGMIYGYMDLR
jgi:predicted RNA-binding Zn-ribbon protein involved in translation (DUF1610 family)